MTKIRRNTCKRDEKQSSSSEVANYYTPEMKGFGNSGVRVYICTLFDLRLRLRQNTCFLNAKYF